MKKKKIRAITVDEMNAIFDEYRDIREIVYQDPDRVRGVIGYKMFVLVRQSKIEVTLRTRTDGVCTYICRLDGQEERITDVNGMEAFRIVQQYYYRVPEMDIHPFSAKPFLYFNPEYEGKRVHAYMYDINSAYSTVMANYDFPDTSVEPEAKVVGKGEIGFNANGDLVHEGGFAYWVFPLMESPYKKFVEKWYQKKKDAKDKKEKTKAKAVMNYYVGMLQKYNCFLRAYIVNSCSEYIKSLMDSKTTLMSNTDSIVSLVPLENLKIGDGLGEWKFEEGQIAYIGNNYQWNDEIPKYRGVPKGWFKKGFDILTDKVPSFGNIYKLNKEKLLLEEEIYNGNSKT